MRHTRQWQNSQKLAILAEWSAGARPTTLIKKYKLGRATLYDWRRRYPELTQSIGMPIDNAQHILKLTNENNQLKELIIDLLLKLKGNN